MVVLIIVILEIVALWEVFEKAGREGWKSIIPILNFYELTEIGGVSGGKTIAAYLLASFFTFFAVLCFSTTDVEDNAAVAIGVFCTISAISALILWSSALILSAQSCSGIAKGFGHGSGFGAGLFFLQPIFIMILAFSDDKYDAAAVNSKLSEPRKSTQPASAVQPMAQQQPTLVRGQDGKIYMVQSIQAAPVQFAKTVQPVQYVQTVQPVQYVPVDQTEYVETISARPVEYVRVAEQPAKNTQTQTVQQPTRSARVVQLQQTKRVQERPVPTQSKLRRQPRRRVDG